jgi:aminoglycoside phosphotransferase (APT) family kinase protein
MTSGIALPMRAVESWLVAEGVPVAPPLTARLITGGRSNLTYLLSDANAATTVLRRPPLSGVIASAHDVLREHRIMAALYGSGVPVPAMLAACPDESVIGAPFIVMDYVDGVVLRDQDTAEAQLDETARSRVGASMVEALARLHTIVPDEVGLGDLGKGVDYIARQLARWEQQLERLGVPTSAAMRDILGRLQAGVPGQASVRIVHGDFRPGNAVVGTDGNLRAVLDWELATLGDPLADLGWLVAYWGSSDPGEAALPMSVPTRAAGFGSSDEVTRRYVELTGRSLDELGFYVAFALWRLAAILSGVNARARRGAYGRDDGSTAAADVDDRVEQLVAAAQAATEAAGR